MACPRFRGPSSDGDPQRRGRDANPRGGSTPPTRFPVALLKPLGHLSVPPARVAPGEGLQAEPADAPLAPSDVVRELVAQRPLDLRAQQLRVPAEVALERV